MMMIASLAAVLLAALPQSAPQTPPATPLPSVEVAAPAPPAEARQICRFETVTGSNRRARVCREVRTADTQRQETREMMRDLQRPRLPDS
jgi:hypothetical protein